MYSDLCHQTLVLILSDMTEVLTITAEKGLTRLVSSIQNSVRKIPDLRCGIWNTHFISFIEIAEYFILHYFDSKWSFYKKKPLLKLNKPAKRNNKKVSKNSDQYMFLYNALKP